MGADLSGKVIDGRYQILERMAEGAMGVVYRGTRLKLDRPVAIKVMHAALPEEMKARERFEREAKLMARLEHPHCVAIIDFGLYGAKPYVVMELVRGHSLHDMLVEQGRVEIPRAVDILTQVLSGLAHAHEQGIIHRDIKPANIMVTPKAPLGVHARILDFGLARMLGGSASISDGVAVGTPSYMAPEQCRGETLGVTVDIYACGVVLFEMLTGKKPFVASEPIQIVKKHLEEMPPRLADIAPGNYGALEGIVARALAKSPADRFPSAFAMADALSAALAGRDKSTDSTMPLRPASVEIPITVGSSMHVPAKHDDTSSALRRSLPVSRGPRTVLLLLVLLAAAGGAAFYTMRERDAANPAPAPAPAVIDAAVALPVDAAPDPVSEIITHAEQLAAAGKLELALDRVLDARKRYPDRAALAALAGKLFFAKLWWNDGLASYRAAFVLDPALRRDPQIAAAAVRAFTTTPAYDHRLAQFVLELGATTAPILDEVVRSHPNPQKRARAAALRKRLPR